MMSGGLQFVVEESGHTQLWDCPGSILDGQAECTTYLAPDGFSNATSLEQTGCGIVVAGNAMLWLVRPNAGTEELLPASGIVRCTGDEIVSFLGRLIDYRMSKRKPVKSKKISLTAQYE
jgi:hypothetical protein